MTTPALSVTAGDKVTCRALATFFGKRRGAHISFATVEPLLPTLTRNRLGLLRAVTRDRQ